MIYLFPGSHSFILDADRAQEIAFPAAPVEFSPYTVSPAVLDTVI